MLTYCRSLNFLLFPLVNFSTNINAQWYLANSRDPSRWRRACVSLLWPRHFSFGFCDFCTRVGGPTVN